MINMAMSWITKNQKNCAVFLDRDGTIIHHVPYLSDPDQLKLFPDTVNSLTMIRAAGFLTILVTNQSGVGRGFITADGLKIIHERLNNMLHDGGTKLDAIYYCYHHPDDNCICRKPKPGMLISASEKYNIDLERSYIIGDDPKDVEAGSLVGCKTVLMSKETNLFLPVTPSFQAETLYSATEWVLQDATSSLRELKEMESSDLAGTR